MESSKGIKAAVQQDGILTRKRFEAIRRELHQQLILPTLSFKGAGYVTYGQRLAIKVQGLPLPTLDLYENRLVESESDGVSHKLFAVFPGAEAPLVVPAEYDPKAAELHVTVPQHAVDGSMSIRFRVQERLGPADLMEKLDPEDKVFRTALAKYNPNRSVPPHCQCAAPTWEETKGRPLPPQPCLPHEPDDEELPDNVMLTEAWVDTSMALSVRCYAPDVLEACGNPEYNQCPICPYGAIEIHVPDGICRVDPDRCRGQSHRIRREGDRRGECSTERRETSVCWECFNPDDTVTSTQCLKRRLRKTAHITISCCSDCPSCSKLSGDDDAAEVCLPGAITWQEIGAFDLDKDICTGCMVCIDNINCWLNTAEEPQDRTLRMVAYLRPSQWPLALDPDPPF
jgi:Fe-S-cluster-containing dehydrogenase component